MRIKYGPGKTKYGPGVQIKLTPTEIVLAIHAYIMAHGVNIYGPRTTRIDGHLVRGGEIYVDPSGSVMCKGKRICGNGKIML